MTMAEADMNFSCARKNLARNKLQRLDVDQSWQVNEPYDLAIQFELQE